MTGHAHQYLPLASIILKLNATNMADVIKAAFEEANKIAAAEMSRRFPKNKASKQIIDSFLKLSNSVLKRHLEAPSKRHQYELIQGFPVIQRELHFWRKQIVRLMKPRPNMKEPWTIHYVRNLPDELFCLLRCNITERQPGIEVKATKYTWTGTFKSEEDLKLLFSQAKARGEARRRHRAETDVDEIQGLLEKTHEHEGFSKVICNRNKPFQIRYSFSKEVITIKCHYGCWNRFSIPQHY